MSASKNLAKVVPGTRRIHRERSQPRARAHLGLLEKKKDYKLRAKDYHRKQDTLKELRFKAAMRNPDEFYFAMHNAQTKDGVHTIERDNALVHRTVKTMKTQDLVYLNHMRAKEQKKIEALQSELQGLGEGDDDDDEDEDDDDDDGDDVGDGTVKREKKKSRKKPQHTIFFDSNKERLNFEATKHFKTTPELVKRRHNRLQQSTIEEQGQFVAQPTARRAARKLAKARRRKYKELEARKERKRKLDKFIEKLQEQKNLMGKGKRRKIVKRNVFGEVDESKTVYVWKRERKR